MLTITEISDIVGVTPKTLRQWEKNGKLTSIRTSGGHRRYILTDVLVSLGLDVAANILIKPSRLTITYARVSSQDQKFDLQRQIEVLKKYSEVHGYNFEMISDLGSGINYRKKGLIRLIKMICAGLVERLVITHKDRLLRFGSELIFMLCEIFNCEIVIVNNKENSTFEEDLTNDVLEIITVFSARLYGSRSHKNKELMQELKKAADSLK